ncbi:MAG: C4-type zinc ribbon domain-containing protein [Isosphaeraceae bacterium]
MTDARHRREPSRPPRPAPAAKALRDRLATGPKLLAARQQVLAQKQAEVARAQAEAKKSRVDQKSKEVQIESIKAKTADLRIKLNTIKKQAEYDALRNQIATDNASGVKLENEILELMVKTEAQDAQVRALETEAAAVSAEVDKLRGEIEAKAEGYQAQLAGLEAGIAEAEAIIPADQRDQYRRVLKQRAADAMAAVEGAACTGCFVTVTAQTMNELINAAQVTFCKSCGRVLYLHEDEMPAARR